MIVFSLDFHRFVVSYIKQVYKKKVYEVNCEVFNL